VLSGVTEEEVVPQDDPPDFVVADLATLVKEHLADAADGQESAPQESA
jgi:hypothetical protein